MNNTWRGIVIMILVIIGFFYMMKQVDIESQRVHKEKNKQELIDSLKIEWYKKQLK